MVQKQKNTLQVLLRETEFDLWHWRKVMTLLILPEPNDYLSTTASRVPFLPRHALLNHIIKYTTNLTIVIVGLLLTVKCCTVYMYVTEICFVGHLEYTITGDYHYTGVLQVSTRCLRPASRHKTHGGLS